MAVHQRPRQTPEEREKQNALLKRFGYRWTKEGIGGTWVLLDLNGGSITPEQALEDIASRKAEEVKPRFSTASRAAAILWAHSLASRTQRDRPVVVLDTETTGVDMTDVAVQIGVVNLRGDILMHTLVHPDGTEISEGALKKHGIGMDRLSDAPLFTSIWDDLYNILNGSDMICYNTAFDARIVAQMARKYGLTMPALRTHCLMQQYTLFYGEVTSQPMKVETYMIKSLEDACAQFDIVNGGAHDALADAMATRDVLVAMAALYED